MEQMQLLIWNPDKDRRHTSQPKIQKKKLTLGEGNKLVFP
jgi:hypothetical protein